MKYSAYFFLKTFKCLVFAKHDQVFNITIDDCSMADVILSSQVALHFIKPVFVKSLLNQQGTTV